MNALIRFAMIVVAATVVVATDLDDVASCIVSDSDCGGNTHYINTMCSRSVFGCNTHFTNTMYSHSVFGSNTHFTNIMYSYSVSEDKTGLEVSFMFLGGLLPELLTAEMPISIYVCIPVHITPFACIYIDWLVGGFIGDE